MNCLKLTSIVALTATMLVFLFTNGCASRPAGAKTITHQQLVDMVAPTYQQSFVANVTYCGSTNGFDHFKVEMPLTSSKRATEYRIHEWDSPIRNRYPLGAKSIGYHPLSGMTDDEARSDLERMLRKNIAAPWTTNTVSDRLFEQQPSLLEPSPTK